MNWPGPVLLVEYGPPAAKAAPWADAQRAFRIPLEVNAAGYERVDKPAEAAIKWAAPPDPASLRVVEVGADGAVADNNVPFQLDPDGELVWLLKGRTAPHATRRYHVYFNNGRGGTAGSGSPMAVTDNVEFEGQPSLRIATPAGVYTYHKEGAGFASIADRDGVEWLGYHPGNRAAGEYRGIPNLGNDFGHPGHKGESGSVSRVESRGALRVRIHSERPDGKWASRWDIYPGHARLTMLRNDTPYWFLYEGTPGGKLDLKDGFLLLPNGARMPLTEAWSGDMPGPEWIAFTGNGSKRMLYAVNHQDDNLPDQYYQMEGDMTVFGFGREYRCCARYFDWSPAEFTIGFAEATTYGRSGRCR